MCSSRRRNSFLTEATEGVPIRPTSSSAERIGWLKRCSDKEILPLELADIRIKVNGPGLPRPVMLWNSSCLSSFYNSSWIGLGSSSTCTGRPEQVIAAKGPENNTRFYAAAEVNPQLEQGSSGRA